MRKNIPRDPKGYEQFIQMIQGIGWSEDEYWEKSKEVYRKAMIIGKYKNQYLRPVFNEQNKELSQVELEQEFKEYYENYKENLFNNCPIQYFSE